MELSILVFLALLHNGLGHIPKGLGLWEREAESIARAEARFADSEARMLARETHFHDPRAAQEDLLVERTDGRFTEPGKPGHAHADAAGLPGGGNTGSGSALVVDSANLRPPEAQQHFDTKVIDSEAHQVTVEAEVHRTQDGTPAERPSHAPEGEEARTRPREEDSDSIRPADENGNPIRRVGEETAAGGAARHEVQDEAAKVQKHPGEEHSEGATLVEEEKPLTFVDRLMNGANLEDNPIMNTFVDNALGGEVVGTVQSAFSDPTTRKYLLYDMFTNGFVQMTDMLTTIGVNYDIHKYIDVVYFSPDRWLDDAKKAMLGDKDATTLATPTDASTASPTATTVASVEATTVAS